MPAPHSPEFRHRAVALARLGDRPVREVAQSLGISQSCLRNWLRQDKIDTGARPGLSTHERDELTQLRRNKLRLELEHEILKRAAAYFARENPPKMIYPVVRELAADHISVAVAGRVLGVSTSGYYNWRDRPTNPRHQADLKLVQVIRDIHRDIH